MVINGKSQMLWVQSLQNCLYKLIHQIEGRVMCIRNNSEEPLQMRKNCMSESLLKNKENNKKYNNLWQHLLSTSEALS